MKSFITILLTAIASQIWCQDIHIYYNVHRDSIWYMKNGKEISNLEIKKDKMVYFHLVEFNNYLYKATFDVTQTSTPYLRSGIDSSGTHGAMPSMFSSILKSSMGSLPFFNMPIFGNLLSSLSGVSGGQARGGLEELELCKNQLTEMEAESAQINAMIGAINQRRKAFALLNSDFSFINTLYMNESIKPSSIKEMVLMYFKEALLIEANKKFEMSDIAELNAKLLEVPQMEMNLKSLTLTYQDKYKALEKSMAALKLTDHGIDELYPLMKKFEQTSPQILQTLKQFTAESSPVSIDTIVSAKTDLIPRIQEFYLKYEEIMNNSFTYTHQVKCEEKFLYYTLNLYKKESLNHKFSKDDQPDKTIEVKITSYGSTRISTSVGLSAGKFATTPQKFYVRNDVLTAQDLDPYIPMISTMIHLSFDLRSPVTPAISLGIALPVSNSETVDNISFLLGPSLFIGKKKEFVISGGAMYSRVQRLAKGFEVGDSIVIGEGEIPTEKKYAIGYFLGISYNLAGY